MSNPAPEELRVRLDEFVRYRHEHLRGDEKGEAQVFLDRLFRAFDYRGVYEAGATLEECPASGQRRNIVRRPARTLKTRFKSRYSRNRVAWLSLDLDSRARGDPLRASVVTVL